VIAWWPKATCAVSSACRILAFLLAQRVRATWCSQETSGSKTSLAHLLHMGEMPACGKSTPTPAHQKSTRAARAGNCLRTFFLAP
jgi:hypothetical protein